MGRKDFFVNLINTFALIFKNYTTYQLSKSDDEIRGKSFAFVIMKKIIPENICETALQKVTFTKDKKVFVVI